jgi:hypothetical protein
MSVIQAGTSSVVGYCLAWNFFSSSSVASHRLMSEGVPANVDVSLAVVEAESEKVGFDEVEEPAVGACDVSGRNWVSNPASMDGDEELDATLSELNGHIVAVLYHNLYRIA